MRAFPSQVLRTFTWGLDASHTIGSPRHGSAGASARGAGGVGGLVRMEQGGVEYYPIYDPSHNVTGLMRKNNADNTLTLVASYVLGPFGEVISATAYNGFTDTNPFRFSTKYTDSETGLVYFGHRYYHSKLGRFINRDPAGESGGINLHGYVGNNPANRWDYLGMAEGEGWQYASFQDPDGNWVYSIDWSGGLSGWDILDAGIRAANNQNYIAQAEAAIANQLTKVSEVAWRTFLNAVANGNALMAETTKGWDVVVTLGADVTSAWEWVAGDLSAASGINVIESSITIAAGYAPNSTGGDDCSVLGIGVKKNLGQGAEQRANLWTVTVPNGVYAVGAEGSRDYVFDRNNNRVTPDQLAAQIKSDPNYRAGTPIWLFACNTGLPGGFASKLAPLMNVTVTAPNNFLFVYSDGHYVVAPIANPNTNQKPQPDLSKPGAMVPFPPHPERSPPTRPGNQTGIQ